MKRRGTLAILATGATAAALGAGVAWWRTAPKAEAIGATDLFFASSFQDADGAPRALAQWRGQPLVVNFWATWCPPCVEEMPDLQKVRDEFRSRGAEVIGIGIDNLDKIRRFRDNLRLTLPLLVAGVGGSELNRALGNESGVLPYTVLIGADGRIRQRQVGRVKVEQLRRWLDEALRSA